MADIDAAVLGFAALDEEALGRPWAWRGGRLTVREALYRTLEDAQAALLQAGAGPQPESRRILALAQRAFGELHGALVGLPAGLLDRTPRPGEWSVSQTLQHIALVERRYALQTLYAAERAETDPVRIPEDRLRAAEQGDTGGDAAALLGRIGQARAETNRRLGDRPPDAMTRPSVWMQYAIDVRFRLHRFAVHIAEHTIQCDKALDALAWRPSEGRRIMRQVLATLGEAEGLGGPAATREVEARLVDRFASLPR
jgi:hypothetical protein